MPAIPSGTKGNPAGIIAGSKVRITPNSGAQRDYPAFCKAFTGRVGKFIRLTLTSMDRKAYPEDFAMVAVEEADKSETFLTVDHRWLTTAS